MTLKQIFPHLSKDGNFYSPIEKIGHLGMDGVKSWRIILIDKFAGVKNYAAKVG
jgi:hypothetical protein